MRNIFMLLTVLLLLTACGEETTTYDNGNIQIGFQPTETKITATGLQSSYNLPISDAAYTGITSISFLLHNKTANDYNNIKLTPVLKSGDTEITSANGFTAICTYTSPNMVSNSGATTTIQIKYTGAVNTNLDLYLKISSDNMPEEELYIGNVSFYTYIQAFHYNGTYIMPVTSSYNITTQSSEPVKIILSNYFTVGTNIRITSSNNGTVTYPTENFVIGNNDVVIPPCQKSIYANDSLYTITLAKYGACYVELNSSVTDVWNYGIITTTETTTPITPITPITPTGYKATDPINITVQ